MNHEARRRCLLTGASGRLGTFFCRHFAHRYEIVAVTRSRPLPVPTQHQRFVDPLEPDSQLPANTNHVFEVQADLTDDSALRRVVEIAMARLGGVDLLVNAAVTSPRMSLLAFTPEELQEQFLLNTTVPVRLAAVLAEQCWLGQAEENRRRNRNIVNLSSSYGTYLGPFAGRRTPISGYGASKAALNFLSIELASQLRASGIRVNVLAATTFPTLVPTGAVARQIVALDQGNASGRIVVVRESGLDVVLPGLAAGPRAGNYPDGSPAATRWRGADEPAHHRDDGRPRRGGGCAQRMRAAPSTSPQRRIRRCGEPEPPAGPRCTDHDLGCASCSPACPRQWLSCGAVTTRRGTFGCPACWNPSACCRCSRGRHGSASPSQ